MGCCTSLIDLCRQMGMTDCFDRCGVFHFFDRAGVRSDFGAVRWLPPPLHLLPALARQKYLTPRERLSIACAIRRLAGPLATPEQTIGQWLRRNGQTDEAIARFWSPIIVAALSQPPDSASLAAARKVFVDGFLASRDAYQLLLPRLPLQELIDRRMGAWLAGKGVAIHRGARIKQIEGDACGVSGLVLCDDSRRTFDCTIVAVAWSALRALLSDGLAAALPWLSGMENIRPAGITAVHLWHDRPLHSLPHAVLLERVGQWVFADAAADAVGHHCQVVISASHTLASHDHNDILATVCDDLAAVWPTTRDAKLLHHRVIAQPAAVFAVEPGLDHFRPPQQTAVENLFLAGDWTATGWPGTMEGAVRSGCMAADAILARRGVATRGIDTPAPKR
jgi:squalene-associated FAD-dependent desaturase